MVMFQGINVWTELTMSSVVLARMDEGPWWEHECQNITELKNAKGRPALNTDQSMHGFQYNGEKCKFLSAF